jgi:hypothetical protein
MRPAEAPWDRVSYPLFASYSSDLITSSSRNRSPSSSPSTPVPTSPQTPSTLHPPLFATPQSLPLLMVPLNSPQLPPPTSPSAFGKTHISLAFSAPPHLVPSHQRLTPSSLSATASQSSPPSTSLRSSRRESQCTSSPTE